MSDKSIEPTKQEPIGAVARVARAMEVRAAQPAANLKSLEPVLVGGLGDAWPYLAHAAIEAHKAALAEAGYKIVGREPTETMIAASWDLTDLPAGNEGIWIAMWDAAE
jgi:hypothetical protein